MAKKLSGAELLDSLDEAELQERIAGLEKELQSLKILHKAATVRKHGKPPRKTRAKRTASEPAAKPSQDGSAKARIFQYLIHNGPTKPALLAAALDLPLGTVSGTMSNDDRLEKTADGWQVKRAYR